MDQDFIIPLLNVIHSAGKPVGATYLSTKLNIPQTSIGRILLQLEEDGLLTKISNKGRKLTSRGVLYLEEQKNQALKMNAVDSLMDSVTSTSKKRLIEILKIRKLLEGQAVEEACNNANESQMAELESALSDYNASVKMGYMGNEEDLILHLTIAKISGNLALYQILKIILTEENGYVKLAKETTITDTVTPSDHASIVNAVLQRDANAAKQAMEKHLDNLTAYVDHNNFDSKK